MLGRPGAAHCSLIGCRGSTARGSTGLPLVVKHRLTWVLTWHRGFYVRLELILVPGTLRYPELEILILIRPG